MLSTHKAELVKIELQPHTNADSLSVIPIRLYSYVGKTDVWKDVSHGVWFCPDTLLDTTRPEFSELKPDGKYNVDSNKPGAYARIKAKKLRGVVSYGYMIPAKPEDLTEENLFDKYGCGHYNVPESVSGGPNQTPSSNDVASGPDVYSPKYDLDSFLYYGKEVFTENEPVFVTEKLDGENARFVFSNGEFHCGSRTQWKKEFGTPPSVEDIEKQLRGKLEGVQTSEEIESRVTAMKEKITQRSSSPAQNKWWKALRENTPLMEWLESHPDHLVYGELYGGKGGFPYDTNKIPRIAAFDIMVNGEWLSPKEARELAPNIQWVPTIEEAIPFNIDKLVAMAEGNTVLGTHIKEGVVVSPLKERSHPSVGRVKLKIVSPTYLEKGK